MVSALWKASADGNVAQVTELLSEGSQVDLEIKDQAGVTPLIGAVKNGHFHVVRLLLDKGADPTNPSAQGPPEQHTSDPAILELLSAAKAKMTIQTAPGEQVYPHDPSGDAAKAYYPPPGPYYYPMPPPMMPEGVAYYPPPPPPPHMSDHPGVPNLPPPEIARMIPCRYFPACRYGTSCMFLHPQGPYLQGPLPPPAQYPAPYDPMNPTPYPYYPVPPPSFQSSPNGAPMPTVSPTLPTSVPPSAPPPPMTHSRANSELAPPVQPGYPPAGPPMPYGVVPPPYAHGGPVPIPMPQHSPMHSPQQAMYPSTSPGAMIPGPSQYPPQGMVPHPYPPQGIPNGHQHDPTTSPKSPLQHAQPDGYGPGHRDGYGHQRRGSVRRPSFGISRKPPCLFFPAGRCKNGDDCRFPHVLDGAVPPPQHFAPRNGHRPRPSFHANGVTGLEDKFATLSTQDNEQNLGQTVANGVNGVNGGHISNGSSRSQSTDPGNRGRSSSGFRPSNGFNNGYRNDKKHAAPAKPQRVPSADEFPVLGGASTPPLRSPGSASGWTGLTAAQVLQAPAPKRDSQPGTRGTSPAPTNDRPSQSAKDDQKTEGSGITSPAPSATKLPISFAAVAAPEAVKEVAIAA